MTYICKECKKSFENDWEWKLHLRQKHKNEDWAKKELDEISEKSYQEGLI